jgi:hypothetical protein
LEKARADRDAAQHELDDAKDKAISQVWQYYTSTKLAFRRLDVAAALLDASEKSYQQTFEGYLNGLNSLVDVLDAQRALSSARYTQLDTRATLLESTAALAFASGDLGPRLTYRNQVPSILHHEHSTRFSACGFDAPDWLPGRAFDQCAGLVLSGLAAVHRPRRSGSAGVAPNFHQT